MATVWVFAQTIPINIKSVRNRLHAIAIYVFLPHFIHFFALLPKPQELQRCACILANDLPHLTHLDPLLPNPQLLHKNAMILAKFFPHLMQSSILLPNPQLLHNNAVVFAIIFSFFVFRIQLWDNFPIICFARLKSGASATASLNFSSAPGLSPLS